jgi:hypothetical protein
LLLLSFMVFCTVAALSAQADAPRLMIGFQTMYGVDGPFVGSANSIRGIVGDELPWEVEKFARGGEVPHLLCQSECKPYVDFRSVAVKE